MRVRVCVPCVCALVCARVCVRSRALSRRRPAQTLTPPLPPPLFPGPSRWVWDCVFSVDGAYLVTASSDASARLWDLASGDAIRLYSGHHKALTCCALNDSAIDGRDSD